MNLTFLHKLVWQVNVSCPLSLVLLFPLGRPKSQVRANLALLSLWLSDGIKKLDLNSVLVLKMKSCVTFLGLLIPDWNVTIRNITTTTMEVHWQNVTPVIKQGIIRYVVVISNTSGIVPNAPFVPGNTTFVDVLELSPYTRYQVTVFGVNERKETFKSSYATVWTKEGGKYWF